MRPPQGIEPALIALAALPALALCGCSRNQDTAALPPEHTVLSQPAFPPSALITPPDLPFPVGLGFAATAGGQHPPVLLTASHLLATAVDGSNSAIAIPKSSPLGAKSAAGDIAAFAVPQGLESAALELATDASSDQLWIATQPKPDSAPVLLPVDLMAKRGGHLYYRISDSNAAGHLATAAGAPVLDMAGRAIAVHLGTAQDPDGSHFGMGNPVSRFLPHLVAALPPTEPSGAQIAAAPDAEPGEITAED